MITDFCVTELSAAKPVSLTDHYDSDVSEDAERDGPSVSISLTLSGGLVALPCLT